MFISYSDPQMVENMLNSYYNPEGQDASAETLKSLAEVKENYNNFGYRFGMTLMEIFPVGLFLTLIFAAINAF